MIPNQFKYIIKLFSRDWFAKGYPLRPKPPKSSDFALVPKPSDDWSPSPQIQDSRPFSARTILALFNKRISKIFCRRKKYFSAALNIRFSEWSQVNGIPLGNYKGISVDKCSKCLLFAIPKAFLLVMRSRFRDHFPGELS